MLLTGCSGTGEAEHEVIRIGYQKTGTLNLLRLRQTLEADLARTGERVEWVGFPAGPQLLEALNAGVIDFGHTGDTPPILAQAAGVPFVYVGYEPSRPRSEAVIVPAKSPLQSVKDLKGKRIALNKGSNVHYLLVRALKAAGVPYDQVQTVFLSPSDARAAFEGGSVDAWAVWDPYLADAEIHASARVLVDGDRLVANREFHLASRRLANERKAVVRTVVAALAREGQWASDHRNAAAAMLADELGIEKTVVERAIERKAYGIAPMNDEVISEQQELADAFHSLGLIPSHIVVSQAVAPDVLGSRSGSADQTPAHHIAGN